MRSIGKIQLQFAQSVNCNKCGLRLSRDLEVEKKSLIILHRKIVSNESERMAQDEEEAA